MRSEERKESKEDSDVPADKEVAENHQQLQQQPIVHPSSLEPFQVKVDYSASQ